MRSLCLAIILSLSVQADDLADLRKAAESGNAKAQNSLGITYQWGKGVERDYEQAAKWFRAAAKQNYSSAQFNLAVMYLEGQTGDADQVKAAAWFTLAKENGDRSSEQALQRMAEDGKSEAPSNGKAEAGRMLLLGQEIKKDPPRGLQMLVSAAEEGSAYAELVLCVAYVRGDGLAHNPQEGRKWCDRAVKHHHPAARAFLGRELLTGEHLPRDRAEGIALLTDIVPLGGYAYDDDSFQLIGSTETDPVEAEKWFLIGVMRGCQPCAAAHNEQKAKLGKDQLKLAVKLANQWLQKHGDQRRIDSKKLGL
jgi:TPR repeat protein